MVENASSRVNAVGWVLATFCTIFVALRVYARTIIVGKFGWDDGLMVFAWASAITTTALVTVGTTYGFAMHAYDIKDPHDLSEAIKYTWIPPAISLVASCSAKLAMVVFLLRLLGRAVKLYHKIILYSASVIMIGANIFSCVILFGFCDPPQKAWKPQLEGSCMSPSILDVAGRGVSAYNAFMDLLCALFAVLIVWQLNMKRSTKLGLAVLMGGGIFGTAATMVKFVMMGNIKNTPDMTWAWMPIAIWYLAEMHVIIIAGSVPTLRPIWTKIRGKEYSGNQNAYNTPGSGGFGKFSSGKLNSAGDPYSVPPHDIDGIETRRSYDGASRDNSSVDKILPQAYTKDKSAIRVTNEVQVGYSQNDPSHRAHFPGTGFGGSGVQHYPTYR